MKALFDSLNNLIALLNAERDQALIRLGKSVVKATEVELN